MGSNLLKLARILEESVKTRFYDKGDVKSIVDSLRKAPKDAVSAISKVEDIPSAVFFDTMKLHTPGVAKPSEVVYRPAVRTTDGILSDPDARIHAEALTYGLMNKGKNPFRYDFSKVKGTGALSPKGNYHEMDFFGDVPTRKDQTGLDLRDFIVQNSPEEEERFQRKLQEFLKAQVQGLKKDMDK